MEVFIQKTGDLLTMEHHGNARSLLEKVNVNPETVLVVKDGILITEDDSVDDANRIDLLSVISGG